MEVKKGFKALLTIHTVREISNIGLPFINNNSYSNDCKTNNNSVFISCVTP